MTIVIVLSACKSEEKKTEKDIPEGVKVMEPEALADVFLAGDFEKVYQQMSKGFKKDVSLKQLEGLGVDFNTDVDAFILRSDFSYGDEVKQFVWTDESELKGIIALFDQEDIIQGLQIMELTTFPETDEVYTKTVFDFPFEDEWFVFWGGTNSLLNYHYEYENQRYAFDFVVMQGNITYEGDPNVNESYYAFGQKYLAPADGTVVKVENAIEDNEPVGEMNEQEPMGNYVILDHGNGEYSYLAHFKHQSIEVKEGDKVKQGDLLGLVGNSGNSSEPHIHFHVADSPDPMESKSIRIQFEQDEAIIQGDRLK